MPPNAVATAVLNSMTFTELSLCLRQIWNSPQFYVVNSHIPFQDRVRVRENIITRCSWPNYPIFSPYATTHDQYSQGRYIHCFAM